MDRLTDGQYSAAARHFGVCPLPPDAGCVECHAFEKERRLRCHGDLQTCHSHMLRPSAPADLYGLASEHRP